GAAHRQANRRHEDARDQDRDHQLYQREASGTPAHALHRFSCQDPMSASLPSPPDLPSAPKRKTSISPLLPGCMYWYGLPHGSLGGDLRYCFQLLGTGSTVGFCASAARPCSEVG